MIKLITLRVTFNFIRLTVCMKTLNNARVVAIISSFKILIQEKRCVAVEIAQNFFSCLFSYLSLSQLYFLRFARKKFLVVVNSYKCFQKYFLLTNEMCDFKLWCHILSDILSLYYEIRKELKITDMVLLIYVRKRIFFFV